MVRRSVFLALALLPTGAIGAGPIDGMLSPEMYGGPGVMSAGGDPCDKGTIFTALKVVRAYRDNQVFAFKHFEGKRLDISGRLVAIKRDLILNEQGQEIFNGFVALVTPDGKPPTPGAPPVPFGLEFRFPEEKLKSNPQLACDLAELFPGQFVTLRGTVATPGLLDKAGRQAVIFNDADFAR